MPPEFGEERFSGDAYRAFEEILMKPKYRMIFEALRIYGATSIPVDFMDISAYDPALAKEVFLNPSEMLSVLAEAAFGRLSAVDLEYAHRLRSQGITRIEPRLEGFPGLTPIRGLKSNLIDRLVAVEGIVTRATPVQPLISKAAFICRACGGKTMVEQRGQVITGPLACPKCERRGLELSESESEFVDSQLLRLQELFEELPPGQIPRWIEVQAVGSDLIDVGRPGDRVRVVGILRAAQRGYVRPGRPRAFRLYIEANNITPLSREYEAVEISPEDEKRILEEARRKDIYGRLVESIAPNIYGLDHVKEAILLQLMGGVERNLPDIRIRGEINVLLIGDPGTAKTQLLRFASRVAPRGIYASGRGVSAAGLTAAVVKGENNEMMLEAGVVVLADRGLAAVDELEKMRSEDRVALHEAMEQQTVTISKGGIVATLNARAAILASANPTYGRYDPYRTPAENVPLPPTLLSRFDLIFVIRDEPGDSDAKLSGHILTVHGGGGGHRPPIPLNLLRKYIAYARRIEPKLSEEAMYRINEFFLSMRRASKQGEGSETSAQNPLAITPRQLESLVRLTLAHARALLKREATREDAEAAINLMKRSLEDVGIDPATGRPDIDIVMTGRPRSTWDKYTVVLDIIRRLEQEYGGNAPEQLVYEEAKSCLGLDSSEVEKILIHFARAGKIFYPRRDLLKVVA